MAEVEKLKAKILLPLDLWDKHSKETTDVEINTNYLLPRQFLHRLQKIMDELCRRRDLRFKTSKSLCERGLELMAPSQRGLGENGCPKPS